MRFVIALAIVLSSLCAQQAPSPEVDKALRERVKKFYELHIQGKFRQIEPLVAEESKDDFYEASKRKILGFDESTVEYSENFTKALVKTPVKEEWRMPRVGAMVVTPTVPSYWKLENGQWCYYIRKEGQLALPWGTADLTKQNEEQKNAPTSRGIHKIGINEVLGGVDVEKQNIELSSYEKSSDEVLITNKMPGQVDIDIVYPATKGLTVTLSKKVLQSGEVAKLSFNYEPPDPSPKPFIDFTLQILQTGKTITLRGTFAVPPGTPLPKMK